MIPFFIITSNKFIGESHAYMSPYLSAKMKCNFFLDLSIDFWSKSKAGLTKPKHIELSNMP